MGKALEANASPEEAEQEVVAANFVQNAVEDGGRGECHTEPLLTLVTTDMLPVISHLYPKVQNKPAPFLNQGVCLQ